LIASIADHHLFGRLIAAGGRVLSIARPGFGASSPYEMRDLAEWGRSSLSWWSSWGWASSTAFGRVVGRALQLCYRARLPEKTRRVFILSGMPAPLRRRDRPPVAL
jgi:pimeloyl-ACP methyl ester carboxylesterase